MVSFGHLERALKVLCGFFTVKVSAEVEMEMKILSTMFIIKHLIFALCADCYRKCGICILLNRSGLCESFVYEFKQALQTTELS